MTWSRRARWSVAIAGLVAVLVLGILVGRYELLPVSRAIAAVKGAKKRLVVMVVGEEPYVRKELAAHYQPVAVHSKDAPRSIDSSRLPLVLSRFPLADTGVFAASDELVGGALALIEGRVVLMDKLGDFFVYRDDKLEPIDFGRFPNGAAESILKTDEPLSMAALRALYVAYDAARGLVFVTSQKFNAASGHSRFTVSSLAIDRQTLARRGEWTTLFESEDIPDEVSFRGATGGRLVVGGDKLFFSVGDYNFGLVPEGKFGLVAQDPKSAFGKIYEHDLVTHTTRVKSIGHRNPQGMAYTADGRLFDTEHGPEGGDELNLVRDGGNYGWPYRTYGTDYGTFDWPIQFKTPAVAFTPPTYSWVPSIGVSPVIQLTDFHAQWNGDLLVGSLKTQSLFRLRLVDDRVVYSEPIWVGHRVRDILALPNRLVLMTDDPALVFVDVDAPRLADNTKKQKLVEFAPALTKCLACHHFGETNPSHTAPTLANIVGKPIASDSFGQYSDALRKKGGIWSEADLSRFLANPNDFAPGSAMPNLGLTSAQVREVVAALGTRAEASKPH